MFTNWSKKIKSWMLIYIGMVAVFMTTAKGNDLPSQRGGAVSPVSIGSNAPELPVEAIARRADI